MKIKNLLTVLFLSGVILSSCNSETMENKEVNLNSEIDTISYSLGVDIANNLKTNGVDSLNSDAIAIAINDVMSARDLIISKEDAKNILQTYFMKLQETSQSVQNKTFEKNIEIGQNFLNENSKKDGVVTLESGLQYKVLTEGNGSKPLATNTVKVNYHGTLLDGTVFDSSFDRGQPVEFALNQVISGWTEGLQYMSEGATFEFYIPYNLAYGANGNQGIEPYSTLLFKVELLEVVK